MELESQLDGFKKRGLGVAALSYDSVEVLKDFSARRHITFPLLSDPESKIIRAYGLINEIDYPVGHANHGVPFPGTFIADAKGIIRTKDFEPTYQERRTAASLLISQGDPANASVREVQNSQFTLRTSASNPQGATGQRVTLVLDFKMADHMHAYAPGVKGYKPLKLTLAENPLVTAHEVRYPESEPYTFEPLKETVPVFMGEFRVVQDVTVIGPARGAAPVEQIDLEGALDYQVCSDTLCYAPSSMPVQWTIKVIPLDRERAPEALRKKPQP
ncbi:MAG: redoxin domain-containing protein [Vicinamibacteria bacterium]|nr:redoxin domain-containing protein [Vicinamibacteria bacterium]